MNLSLSFLIIKWGNLRNNWKLMNLNLFYLTILKNYSKIYKTMNLNSSFLTILLKENLHKKRNSLSKRLNKYQNNSSRIMNKTIINLCSFSPKNRPNKQNTKIHLMTFNKYDIFWYFSACTDLSGDYFF